MCSVPESILNVDSKIKYICDLMEKMWNSFNRTYGRPNRRSRPTSQPTSTARSHTHKTQPYQITHFVCLEYSFRFFFEADITWELRRASNKNVYVCGVRVYVCVRVGCLFDSRQQWRSTASDQARARENIIIIAALQIYTYLINYN